MIHGTLVELLEWLKKEIKKTEDIYFKESYFKESYFEGISTDTRTLKPNNLFVALTGDHYDAHDFISDVEKKGARILIISRPVKTSLPYILVNDTVKALGKITQYWREKFSLPLIGLTGSNGKTTTKNMLASILSEKTSQVLVTQGNLNNHIGVPLMLAQLNASHEYAVIEMGMNHFHEISYLTHLAKPTTAIITNAGASHLQGVGGTIAGVAKAKGEIFEGLSSDGIAVINQDDEYADYWKSLVNNKKIITFGLNNTADVWAEILETGFLLHYQKEKILITLNLLGVHNIRNAVAAAAGALANNIDLNTIKKGLEKLQPEHGRMEMKKGFKGNIIIIDDTYNANPLSLHAAIETIKSYPQKKFLVLGDMRELGEQGPLLHEECGEFAYNNGIDNLYTLGELTQFSAKKFGKNAYSFDTHESLIEQLKKDLEKNVNENIVVLVKGSRSMKMEKVVEAIGLKN